MTTKTRVITYDKGTGTEILFGGQTVKPAWSFVGRQTTTSYGHHGPPYGGTVGDNGGPFKTERQFYDDNSPTVNINGGGARTYVGKLFARQTAVSVTGFPLSNEMSDLTLLGLGTTAIARTTPTNPVSGLVNALGELRRDGLPDAFGSSILRSEMRARHRVGSEYLNTEFAWKPLVKDLMAFAHASRQAEHILKQYERDSGKNIRRGYTFPSVNSETVGIITGQYPQPAIATQFYGVGGAPLYGTTTWQSDRWFKGCYTYHVQVGSTVRDKILRAAQESNKLFGTRLSPEVVWNLAPWTWAADWVTNVGDVIHNVSAFQNDGLVLRYGYMMEHSFKTVRYDLTMPQVGHLRNVSLSQTFKTEVKKRLRATPYGFGLNTAAFTTRQWAIIGALGLSNAPGKLK